MHASTQEWSGASAELDRILSLPLITKGIPNTCHQERGNVRIQCMFSPVQNHMSEAWSPRKNLTGMYKYSVDIFLWKTLSDYLPVCSYFLSSGFQKQSCLGIVSPNCACGASDRCIARSRDRLVRFHQAHSSFVFGSYKMLQRATTRYNMPQDHHVLRRYHHGMVGNATFLPPGAAPTYCHLDDTRPLRDDDTPLSWAARKLGSHAKLL